MFTEEGLSVLMLSPILAFPARQASAERVSRVLHPLNLLPVCHTMASSSPKATSCFTACLMLSRGVSRGNCEYKSLVSFKVLLDCRKVRYRLSHVASRYPAFFCATRNV